jgi:hypothetical protein
MAQLQFAANAYQARSPQLLSQQCINAFVETSPKDAKTQVPIYGTPGLTEFSRQGSGPILGLHVFQDSLFALSGPALYKIDFVDTAPQLTGTAVLIGNTTLGGLTSMADNGRQLVMVDGSGGWIYQPGGLNLVTTATVNAGATVIPANITGTINGVDTLVIPLDNGATFNATPTGTFTSADGAITITAGLPATVSSGAVVIDPANVLGPIEAAAFKPASTVTFFDSYFCFDARNTRQFFISASNDGTQYSGLDFATASASSSDVVAVRAYHEQLLVFTQRSCEVWWDTGAVSFPFQRYDAAYIERGCAAPFSVCSEDNTVFWMGDDGNFYRMEGFLPRRVSTFAMEHAWAQYPLRFLDCSAFVLDQEGHKFVVCNFPSGEATWVYDIATNLWHQRESWGTPWI